MCRRIDACALFVAFSLSFTAASINESKNISLLVVTVATEETDGFNRLKRSAEVFDIDLKVFGVGENWNGGNMKQGMGGGQKIRILREHLEPYKDRNDLLILFADGYDVIFNAYPAQILATFLEYYSDYKVLFSAEPFCWPDKRLASAYPLIKFGYRYLNSGLYMGYAPQIWSLINLKSVSDMDDDQLYYTSIYLNEHYRAVLEIALDSFAIIFQNLNGVEADLSIEFDGDGSAQIYNSFVNTHPLIAHGNGDAKIMINSLGNYIGRSWSSISGCTICNNVNLSENRAREDWSSIALCVFISKPIPFIEEFFGALEKIEYLGQINLYLYNNQEYNKFQVENFMLKWNEVHKQSIMEMNNCDEMEERESRARSLHLALEWESDFYLTIDGDVHITQTKFIQYLIEKSTAQNVGILAPMVMQQGKLFSNFWGMVSSQGFYARSSDYLEIAGDKRIGLWNVPHISSIFVIEKKKLKSFTDAYTFDVSIDADMSFSSFARYYGHFLYVSNQLKVGFLVVSDEFDGTKRNPEMYMIFDNRNLWASRYIHKKFYDVLMDKEAIEQPCLDVFEFPFMSEKFCAELIDEVEHYGKWSSGTNQDERLEGGYENVPTRDIHMKQIDFERHWLYILDEYVRPIQKKVFLGYESKPIKSYMMFVVRYRPNEQASLRPHHDSSTYSIDVALNKKDVDYKGGGVRFIRYNCTVPADQIGYSIMFPGRLTHLHEGLTTTEGTRYIAVSFIDP